MKRVYTGVVAVQLQCNDGSGPFTGMVEVELTESEAGELADPARACMLAVVQAGDTTREQMGTGQLERVEIGATAPSAADRLLQKLKKKKGETQ